MNDRSSRAHSLFIVTLRQTHLDSNVTISSRLFMADLGDTMDIYIPYLMMITDPIF